VTAIRATSNGIKGTLVDGTVRFQIEVEPCDAALAFEMMGLPGTQVGIAGLTVEATQNEAQEAVLRSFGEEAKQLRLSGFFRSPHVWEALGLGKEHDPGKEQKAWDMLKSEMGYESWSQVPPAMLRGWAEVYKVTRYLPPVYR
jgi:hypothetical protein